MSVLLLVILWVFTGLVAWAWTASQIWSNVWEGSSVEDMSGGIFDTTSLAFLPMYLVFGPIGLAVSALFPLGWKDKIAFIRHLKKWKDNNQ